jgi:negative regulator of flagellin synthesis FlgM
MKITGPGTPPPAEPIGGGPTARSTPAKPAATPGDEVRVSDLAGALAQLGERLSADGEFDQARVDRIKAAIAAGEYKVNPDAVADKLIQSLRDLLGPKA